MSAVPRIARNVALLYSARVTSTLLKFLLFIWIGRILGEATLGKFTFATVFTAFFSILLSLGLDDLLVREVARDKTAASKYLGNIASLRVILSAVVFGLIALVINLMGYPQDTRLAVYIFGGYVVFSSLTSLFRANFRAFEQMQWDSLLEILESVITASVGLLLLFRGFGLIEISLVFLFASIINFIIGFRLCDGKFAKIKFGFDIEFLKTMIKNAIPFCVTMLLILSIRMDTILLSTMKGDAIVGGYNAAYQVVLAFDPLALTFMSAVVPVISRFFISSQVMVQVAYEKSFKYLVILGFPMAVGGMILADKIILLLYGAPFTGSIIALQILIWNILLSCMNRPMLYTLGAINRQGTSALIIIVAVAVSIGLNYLLIPRWSYVGSAFATLVTGSLLTAAFWYAASKYGHRLSVGRLILKPMIASLAMGAIVYVGSWLVGANLLLLVAVGIAVYFLLLYFVRGFSMDDQRLFREAIRMGRRAP